ncbi:MAG: hypothetical protein JOZ42_08140 [Acetobacteraceae bacterium]|nr:hypothetical protein [Acetobacteraceae bacterium]
MLFARLNRIGMRRFGLFAAALALVLQTAVGFARPAEAAGEQLDSLLKMAAICGDGTHGGSPAHAPPLHHHAPDCALCPLNGGWTTPLAILVEPAGLPVAFVERRLPAFVHPLTRAPPARAVRPAFPRGPPVRA